jgi:hypothetical protein
LCRSKPTSCAAEPDAQPVCGCDGQTYASFCEALKQGVSVQYEGSCSAAPQLCTTCAQVAPATALQPCGDSAHMRGPTCLQKPNGDCAYQWLECPPTTGRCDTSTPVGIQSGACWSDADCDANQKCSGANVCPCGAACFGADSPGVCQ